MPASCSSTGQCLTRDSQAGEHSRPVSSGTMKIGIIGAGISGLALGAALHRNGMDVQVYEEHAQIRSGGAGTRSRRTVLPPSTP